MRILRRLRELGGRHLWPGLFSSRLDQTANFNELFSEIMVARGMLPEAPGTIQFSMKVFMQDSTVMNEGLRNGPFRQQAIVPAAPWLDGTPPQPPSVTLAVDSTVARLSWDHPDPDDAFRWVVYKRYDDRWEYEIFGRYTREVASSRIKEVQSTVRRTGQPDSVTTRTMNLTRVGVSAVDRRGNESEKRMFDVP